MRYMFFDTAVNGYYTLSLLQKGFPNFKPLLPATEKITDDAAPFVIEIDNAEKLVAIRNSIGVSLKKIVLLDCNEKIDAIRNYYSQFAIQNIKGKQFYFRFWAADVFQKFIKTCDAKQLREFFGQVQQFVCEDEDPQFSMLYSFNGTKLLTNRVASDASISNTKELVEAPAKATVSEDVLPAPKTDNAGANDNNSAGEKRPRRRFFFD